MTSDEYWYWLSSVPGMGFATMEKLFKTFKNPEEIFKASNTLIENLEGITLHRRNAILASRDRGKIKRDFEKLKKENITFLPFSSESYPDSLKQLYDPPVALFVRGSLPPERSVKIGVVGARECTPYGREITRSLSRELAASGITIISGMARGVDSMSHIAALSCEGKTYAVLGNGVDICYPSSHYSLYWELIEKGGIISEFPPGTRPERRNFPRRNRIIAALSDGILVTEAKKKSGSLITAEFALELGRDIFAVPGRIGDSLSEGCNDLIKAGAKLTTSAQDILDEFDMRCSLLPAAGLNISNNARAVYSKLGLKPTDINTLQLFLDMKPEAISAALTELEMEGLVYQMGKSAYVKRL